MKTKEPEPARLGPREQNLSRAQYLARRYFAALTADSWDEVARLAGELKKIGWRIQFEGLEAKGE